MAVPSEEFARAFGDALRRFLALKNISEAEASRITGIEKATLNTYTHDSTKGERKKPNAEALFRTCADLGFEFEYKGYRITAASLGAGPKQARPAEEQLDFSRQFNLTEDNGKVSLRLRRHPDRVELSLSLKAAS